MTVEHKVFIEKIGLAFLLTIVAYFAAYVFEVGYLRSFGVSWQVAHVTIPSLANMSCGLLCYHLDFWFSLVR